MTELGVLGAAFLGGENLDVLAFRADPLVELLGFRQRNDAVVLAVQHEKRAFDPLCDAFKRELLRPLERGLVVRRAHHPAELEDRGGHSPSVVCERGLVAPDTNIYVPMQCAERDCGRVALLEGNNARRVIAAETVAHNRDALGIERARRRSRRPRCLPPRSRAGYGCYAAAA